ncbi:MAG: Ig-like domain-containing protein [Solobacterium sp.]|nr:Ig-like domain-containing protein [Solobacterium sp.]
MTRFRKILAIVLCGGMMASSFNSGILCAAETKAPEFSEERVPLVSNEDRQQTADTVLAFTSDVHNKQDNTSAERLSSWIDMVVGKYGKIDHMGFCGDMAQASAPEEEYWAYTQKVIDVAEKKHIPACYTTGNHEFRPGNFSETSNPVREYYTVGGKGGEGEDFYIYCLGSDLADSYSAHYTEGQAAALVNNLKGVSRDKMIIVLTHFPLHSYVTGSRKRETENADLVIEALNEVVSNGTPDTSDDKTVVLLWGHNHTLSDTNYGDICAPGNRLVYNTSENSRKIRFYYAAAGCMSDEEYSKGSFNTKGKGLVITIEEDQPGFVYYDAGGNDVTDGIIYPHAPLKVTGVSLDKSEAAVKTGDTVKLNATVTPGNASFTDVKWTSSDETVAAVTDTGFVKTLAEGTAVIRAAGVRNNDVYDECTVTVRDHTEPETGWEKTGKGWIYRTADRDQYKDGIYMIGGKKYGFDADGIMVTGWRRFSGKWYWFASSGVMATGWRKISGKWYRFDPAGVMVTGWKKISGVWYHFAGSGAMTAGWKKISGKWYYFADSGAMVTGWKKIADVWYYFQSSGAMKTGWLKRNDKWYYFRASGAMAAGWNKIGGVWYYFLSSGAMKTGWLKLGDKWYYFNSSGAMVTGAVTVGSKTYTFDSSGVCRNP